MVKVRREVLEKIKYVDIVFELVDVWLLFFFCNLMMD